jgi:zinc transport system substrate-binding protein
MRVLCRSTAWFLALGLVTVTSGGLGLLWQLGGSTAEQSAAPKAATAGLRAVVSIAPLQSLVAPIMDAANSGDAKGRDQAKELGGSVQSVIPPGESEHGFEIPPSKLGALREADLVVLVGLGLDRPVEKFLAANPPPSGRTRRVITFAEVAGLKANPEPEDKPGDDHAGEPAHARDHHSCGVVDPHIWLDPLMVEKLVGAVTESVAEAVKADPARKARVEKAGGELRARVLAVDAAYSAACGTFTNKTIVVGHDAWGRLGGRYGLETVAIAGLDAGEPTPAALDRAAAAVREKKLKVIFVEPQLGERAGRRIAEVTGAQVRRLDPLGSGDWFKMMNDNLAEIKRALGPAAEKDAKP